MPALDYTRRDLTVSLRFSRGGEGVLRVITHAGGTYEQSVPAERIARAMAGDASAVDRLALWTELLSALPPQSEVELNRVAIETTDERFAAIDWEPVVRAATSGANFAIVRSSPTRPRIAEIEPSFPIRVHEVGGNDVPGVVDNISRRLRKTATVVTESSSLARVVEALQVNAWPTADILHFHDLATEVAVDDLLRTARPSQPGTAGWLGRLTDLWQTRLVVIAHGVAASPRMRRYAAILVARGGPGVVLVPQHRVNALYDLVIHDRPLDWIAREMPEITLFVGGGREEAMRFSRIARQLARREVVERIVEERTLARRSTGAFAMHRIPREMEQRLAGWRFEDYEREGMIPLAATIKGSVRQTLRGTGRARRGMAGEEAIPPHRRAAETDMLFVGLPRPARQTRRRRRSVNSAFFADGGDDVDRIEQRGARLAPGQPVLLGIQVGSRDRLARTVGYTALTEETFRWPKEKDGVWLEVALTGLDFENLGAPTQELWLPRRGATDRIFFTVAPRTSTTIAGVARLRFCLYYENNLVQSFRVAALLGGSDLRDRAARLAAALDASPRRVAALGDVGYTMALEYQTVAVGNAESLRPRKLTIFANRSAGEKVFTIKGEELFAVAVNPTVSERIKDARASLQQVSVTPSGGYRYLHSGSVNSGDPAALDDLLRALAHAGWELFSSLVEDPLDQEKVDEILAPESVIHAGHVDLADIVPWSLIYDRQYDITRTETYDDPLAPNPAPVSVQHAVCRAAFPRSDGTVPVTTCKTAPDCLLNDAVRLSATPRLCEETVVCPLRFWGYKHQIEVPAQQAKEGAPPRPMKSAPPRARLTRVVAGVNRTLLLAADHVSRLGTVFAQPRAVLTAPIAERRDLIRELLRKEQPDIVYLYCHAYADRTLKSGSRLGPSLGFGAEADESQLITASQFSGVVWQSAPLVFLNGCGTAGFSPYAPSDFVTHFVQKRNAAAVVGTEVTIWEALAGEMAELFMQRFLAGASAGESLRDARRALLAKANPLGLVYTLYGSADLRIASTTPTIVAAPSPS